MFNCIKRCRDWKAKRENKKKLTDLHKLSELKNWANLQKLVDLQERTELRKWINLQRWVDTIKLSSLGANRELKIGLQVLENVNAIRMKRGSPKLQWDDTLYAYSLGHAKDMAYQRRLFHTSMNESYAENVWGGQGSRSWTAKTIVNGWMNSKMHRTWLLCPNLRHVAVGIAYSPNGMYAAWTFWRSETQSSDWWYVYTPDTPPSWWY